MSSVFGDDAGFWAGHALSEKANTEQKVMLAEALGQERAEKNALITDQRNQIVSQINKHRLENLAALAEYEYGIHVASDVAYWLRIYSDELLDMAEHKASLSTERLKFISARMKEARDMQFNKDHDSWIQNRYQQLVDQCTFPKNDQEAAMVGGYAMPFPGSVPPFLQRNFDDVNHEVYRVLTDQDEVMTLQSKMQRGPMKLG